MVLSICPGRFGRLRLGLVVLSFALAVIVFSSAAGATGRAAGVRAKRSPVQSALSVRTAFIYSVVSDRPLRLKITGALVHPIVAGERVELLCFNCEIERRLYGGVGLGGLVRHGDVGRLRGDIVSPAGGHFQLFGFTPGNHTENPNFRQFYSVVVPPGEPLKAHLERESHPAWYYDS